MPFLEVLTRCYKRPTWLAENQESLRRQSDPDYVQTLLVDDVGIGVARANARLADVAPMLTGDYVWVLDDDDLCTCETLVADLKRITEACRSRPAAVVVRMDHGLLGILPDVDRWWGVIPPEGCIGASALVVRRDVFVAYADWWRTQRYASDYDFTAAVMRGERDIVWVDIVASRVQRISIGRPEGV